MSGSVKENLHLLTYYGKGVIDWLVDAVKSKKFLPVLVSSIAYNLYQIDNRTANLWLFDTILFSTFWANTFRSVVGLSLAVIAVANFDTIYFCLRALPRDIRGIIRVARVLLSIKWADRNNFTVARYLDANAERTPDKVCFYFEDQKWTFRQVQEYSNRVGNHFSRLGYKKGDVIALLMESRPEYVCIWLGLNKIGVTAALVNYNLRLQPLLHSINIVKAKAIIYGYESHNALLEISEQENSLSTLPIFCSGMGKNSLPQTIRNFDEEIATALSSTPVQLNDMKLHDTVYYIYTSGTTGLPKAAPIKQYRFMMPTKAVHILQCINEHDVIYDSLPLYHMAGGMLGVGQALLFGCSVVIRNKFSASQFWKDCIKYNVTVAQYLGETCRYLLAKPPSPEDKAHKVRLMIGNGLRPDMWKAFVTRFNIPQIGEVYGSTEGNANIANIDGKVGAVGFIPRFIYPFVPTALVKVDKVTGEPIRDPATGLCIRCKPKEPGELMAKIVERHPMRDFQGYTDGDSTSKKILRDVFSKGDTVFRTGDIMVMDDLCYIYFKDRTGDTFRWKGENVSTAEVESVLSSCTSYKDAVVYGVHVPNTEGKAGMLAIVDPDRLLDLNKLVEEMQKSLPIYARPLFLRIMDEADVTGTYKLKKVRLQEEGYNVTKIKDPIYFFRSGEFKPLNEALMTKINSGEIWL